MLQHIGRRTLLAFVVAFFTAVPMAFVSPAMAKPAAAAGDVLRAVLPNGLKVVIVRNRLAPVVATSMNYLVGSNETPEGFPGTAHAVEHMMFRGSPGLSAEQLANIGSVMGGNYNAETRETMTQYYYSVPAEDLDVALNIEAARMAGIDCTEKDWDKERGAISQEVSRDMSMPQYKAIERVRAELFAGTPYAHTPLGTRESFAKTKAADLKAFHDAWYAPNNAVLIVVGDVSPETALNKIRSIFAPLKAKKLPARTGAKLGPARPADIKIDLDQPYTIAYLALRVPGYDSRDEAALEVLADVLQSKRFALYDMTASGRALEAFYFYDPMKSGGTALLGAAIPAGADVAATRRELRDIVAGALKNGLPADLVAAAKRHERLAYEQQKNSIEGQASIWAEAVVAAGLSSPDEAMARIEDVTVADVDRVARKYLKLDKAVTVTLVSTGGHKPIASGAPGGPESIALNEAGPVALPVWAKAALDRLEVPTPTVTPTVSTLANGLTLIVQPTNVSDTVSLYGLIRSNAGVQAASGKEGVDVMLDLMMGYGTAHLDRLAFQKAVDEIGASVDAGQAFSASALTKDFDRAVALLADNERNPALPDAALAALKPQYAPFFAARLASPDYLTARAMKEALFPAGDPILREITGETVAGLSRDDLLAYYNKVFRPDMAAVVVVGNITPANARAVVEKYFGTWKAEGPVPDIDPAAVPANKPATVNIPNPSRVQDEVTLAQTLAMTRKDPDYYALALGNAVLGGGVFSARLYNDLRVNSGLVYNVGSHLDIGRSRGVYAVSYGSDSDKVAEADAIVVKDIKDMQSNLVSEQSLSDAKALMVRRISLSESEVRAIAGGYLDRFNLGLPMDEHIHAAKRYIEITPEEVRSAFKKWLRPDDLVRVTQGPSPE